MPDDATPIMPTTPPPAGSTSAPAPPRSIGLDVGERPGDQIDRYRLLEVVGEGGFGVVFMADQTAPVRRRVALKVLKPGMDTKGVVARFEAERQALALMDHPHIAKVFDAGATPTGRPYFVMEYVPGIAITEHCDRHRLTIAQRLELFAQVCDAVAHAHTKGVIHRDLKPTNILVSAVGDKATPKIIDFGIAKAAQTSLAQHTIFTEHGQLIGTVEYMSPEQADLSHQDIDTRSDVYSLGVILYEMLTGAVPFDPQTLRARGLVEMRRVIRESEPPRPSTRLTAQGAGAERVAEARRLRLDELARELRRELEWIPLRALRKDRTERYRSAQDLGDDVRRYLRGEPLLAGPESAAYRLRKFVRRNRGPVAAVGAVTLAVIVGLVGTVWMARRASDRAERALAAEREATAARDRERLASEGERRQSFAARARLIASEADALSESDPALAALVLRELPDELGGVRMDRVRLTMSRASDRLRTRTVMDVQRDDSESWSGPSPSGRWATVWNQGGRHVLVHLADLAILPIGVDDGVTPNTVEWDVTESRFAALWRLGLVRIFDAGGRQVMELKPPASRREVGFDGPMAWNPDGARLALAMTDGGVLICGAASGVTTTRLFSTAKSIEQLAWSADGRWLTARGNDGRVRVWEPASSADEAVLETMEHDVVAVACSPVGSLLAVTDGHTAKVWELESSTERAEVVAESLRGCDRLAWDPAGTALALASDKVVMVLNEGGLNERWQQTFSGSADHLSWSADGQSLLVSSMYSGVTLVLESDSGHVRSTLRVPDHLALWARWAGSGRVVTCLWPFEVRTWALDGRDEPQSMNAVTRSPLAYGSLGKPSAWRADGEVLCAGGAVGVVVVRRTADGLVRVRGHDAYWPRCSCAPDGRLAIVTTDGVAVISPDGGRQVVVAGIEDAIDVQFNRDGDRLACLLNDNRVTIVDTSGTEPRPILSMVHCEEVWWSPDGRLMAIGHYQHGHRVVDRDGLLTAWSGLDRSEPATAHVDWLPGSNSLVVSDRERVHLVDVVEDRELGTAELRSPVGAVRVSPNGHWLAVVSDLGMSLFPLDAHDGILPRVALKSNVIDGVLEWSPDSRLLAVSGLDQRCTILRVEPAGECVEVDRLLNKVSAAQWSPDGELIAAVTTESGASKGDIQVSAVRWPMIRRQLWSTTDAVLTAADRVLYLGESAEQARLAEAADTEWVAQRNRTRAQPGAVLEPPMRSWHSLEAEARR